MPKLPIISGRQLVSALKKIGFESVSQRGSHVKMKDSQGKIVTIPQHRQLKKGTLKKGILNPLGISVEELIKLLKK